MKVTKYPQSCLLLEKDETRIVIDSGTIFSSQYAVDDLGKLDAVLYTHQHPDHFDQAIVDELRSNGAQLYGNESVVQLIEGEAQKVYDNKPFQVGGFSIMPRDLPHCVMVDGSAGPPNTGFVVDGTFFHPGDGVDIENLDVTDLAAPIAGPSVSLHDTYTFIKQVGASRVIPIHYDYFLEDPTKLESEDYELIVLDNGDSTEL